MGREDSADGAGRARIPSASSFWPTAQGHDLLTSVSWQVVVLFHLVVSFKIAWVIIISMVG